MTAPVESAKPSGGVKAKLARIFQPVATDSYNRVLASSLDRAQGDASSIDSDPKTGLPLTDEQKAKRLVAQRDARSPTGHFVLGEYKPLDASQGYGGYYTAKGAYPSSSAKNSG
ncbi:hypothetical protein DL546_008362 [Coniochaeta pulveracea]|uniref:Uncharacterized protein n=1 Tax=Coniochaeta pulveracea TaxID=177199 RepID=A0A420YIY8_9PEZI|nr:hypothetical protein DL546_008362 [Coniochaeta pulveracea]